MARCCFAVVSVWVLLFCVLAGQTAQASALQVGNESLVNIHQQAQIIRTAPLEWQLKDVLAAEQAGAFKPFSGVAASSDRSHAIWLKLELQPSHSFDFAEPRRYLLSHSFSVFRNANYRVFATL